MDYLFGSLKQENELFLYFDDCLNWDDLPEKLV